MAAVWALNALQTFMGAKKGETVLVLADQPLWRAASALEAAAQTLGHQSVLLPLPRSRSGLTLISQRWLETFKGADVIITLTGPAGLMEEHAWLRAFRAAFEQSDRGRWAVAAGIDETTLQRELSAEPRAIGETARRLASQLSGGSNVRIVSGLGTDLRLSIDGRRIYVEEGLLTEPGSFGNLPGGEVFVAPLEASAEGCLVVDGCLGDIPLDHPVTLTFAAGRVIRVEGVAAARELMQRLGDSPTAWTIGEFGVGANPFARMCGAVMVDEKVLGTAHIALGSNVHFGGRNRADTHYDCVIRDAQVSVDGVMVALG